MRTLAMCRRRFVLRLPFKNRDCLDKIDLTQSRYPSRKMLLKLEGRFAADIKLKHMYHSFLKEYEDLGHMPSNELDRKANRFYLPHHGV